VAICSPARRPAPVKPPVLPCRSCIVCATSGSAHAGGRAPIRALILTPTRELAAQVEESVREYGKYLKLKSMVMFGGVGIQPQIQQLRNRVDILVATPGRLLDHAGQRTLDLSRVEVLVLDEADRMLDMGFIHDIKKVLALLPRQRQNLLFSATFSDEIRTLADSLLNRPALIEVARRNAPAEAVTHQVHLVDRERKRELLAHLIRENQLASGAGVYPHQARRQPALRTIDPGGIASLAIHGNKSQSARTHALAEFKAGALTGAGRDRYRRPRSGYCGFAACGQF
jgi:ATP-dependent RNA helicase RhlE